MKKIVLSLVAAALLSACSNSVEKMQTANDTYQNSDREIPSFSPLASGGVTLPQADPTYELPQLNAKKRTRGYSSAFNTISDYQKFFNTI